MYEYVMNMYEVVILSGRPLMFMEFWLLLMLFKTSTPALEVWGFTCITKYLTPCIHVNICEFAPEYVVWPLKSLLLPVFQNLPFSPEGFEFCNLC